MARFDRINDVERTELATFDPDATWNGLTPAGNAKQRRTDPATFTFSDTSLIYDWCEACLLLDVESLKKDGTATGVNTVGLIPGNFSLVKGFVVKSGGAYLYRVEDVNPLIFIRKSLETGQGYSETVGSNEGFILDSGTKTAANANPGFEKQKFTGVKKVRIPLKNWGFFKALKNTLLPAVHLAIQVQFDKDVNILFGTGNADQNKLIIKKVSLRVSNVFLKAGRQEEITASLLSDTRIVFIQEQLSCLSES